MNEIDYTIRSALSSDRSRLLNLIHFGAFTHQHLDWKPPLDWIGSQPYLVLEKHGDLLAALACPPDLPDITWIRLFAVNSLINSSKAWRLLWDSAASELSNFGKMRVAAISLQSWFNEILEESGFEHTDNVVVLIWDSSSQRSIPAFSDITLRPMVMEDLGVIEGIDHEAFGMVWKNSREALELAYQQSSLATVAEMGDEIVGYQYSTSSSMGGHLARLAVKTHVQNKGIGFVIVDDLLRQFLKHGVRRVTVNTQQNNSSSLALYKKAGFKLTGESYRVYQHPNFE